MEENKNINEFDNLFKEAFNNAEVTPPADAWSSIQSQIGSAPAPTATGTEGGSFISGLTSIKGIIIAAAVVTGIVTTVVLTSDKEAAKADKATTENTVVDNNKEITNPDIANNSNTGNDDVELNTGNTADAEKQAPKTPNNGGTHENGTNDFHSGANKTKDDKLDDYVWDFGDGTETRNEGRNEDEGSVGKMGVKPVAQIEVLNRGIICTGSFVKMDMNASKPLTNYVWDFGDGTTSTDIKSPNHIYTKAGEYTIKLSTGEILLDEHTIIVNGPEASFETADLGEGKFKFTNTSVSMAGSTFKWNFGDDSENEGVTSPEHQYYSENATSYKVSLIVTDPVGCADTFENRIINRYLITKEAPTAPNVFTPATTSNPSGFGVNDDFTVAIEGEDYYNLVIYSAKNEVVFRSTDKENKWNGKDLSGNLCAAGSYYYILKYSYQGDDEVRQKSGTVTIIR